MKHTLRSIGAVLAVLAGAALVGTTAGAASAGNPWHGFSDSHHDAGHPWDVVEAGHPWHGVADGFHGSGLSAGHPWSN